MCKPEGPTEEQVRKDNPHFGDKFSVVTPPGDYESRFGYTFYTVVTGGYYKASYLWHPGRNRWELGSN